MGDCRIEDGSVIHLVVRSEVPGASNGRNGSSETAQPARDSNRAQRRIFVNTFNFGDGALGAAPEEITESIMQSLRQSTRGTTAPSRDRELDSLDAIRECTSRTRGASQSLPLILEDAVPVLFKSVSEQCTGFLKLLAHLEQNMLGDGAARNPRTWRSIAETRNAALHLSHANSVLAALLQGVTQETSRTRTADNTPVKFSLPRRITIQSSPVASPVVADTPGPPPFPTRTNPAVPDNLYGGLAEVTTLLSHLLVSLPRTMRLADVLGIDAGSTAIYPVLADFTTGRALAILLGEVALLDEPLQSLRRVIQNRSEQLEFFIVPLLLLFSTVLTPGVELFRPAGG